MGRKRSRSRSRSESGISRRSLLLLAGTGTVGATGAYTTGAFDAVAGGRILDIGTADDDTALLGISAEDPAGDDGEQVTLFELTNRLGSELTSIDAEIVSGADGPIDPGSLRTPDRIPAGGSDVVEGTLSCDGDSEATIEVSIDARGAGESVDLTREVTVSCVAADPDPCAPLDPPGCIEDEFPSGSTDCSVVIDRSGEVNETVRGGAEIGGALDIDAEDEVDITVVGRIADYLGIDTSDEVDVSMGGGASIGNHLQVSTSDEIDLDIDGDIGGGMCIDGSDEIDVTLGGGGTVGSEVSLTSTDEVTVEMNGDNTTGPLAIDTEDEVVVDIGGGSTVDGDVDIDTSDEVDLILDGNERIAGDVDITTTDEVTIELRGSSVIEGDVRIETSDEVDIELSGNAAIRGSVDITTTDEVDISIDGSSTIDGDVTIDTSDEVDLSIDGGSTIGGDVTIDTSDEIDISGCDNIEGEVSPASACS